MRSRLLFHSSVLYDVSERLERFILSFGSVAMVADWPIEGSPADVWPNAGIRTLIRMRYAQLRSLDIMSRGGDGERPEVQRNGRRSWRQVEERVQRVGSGREGGGTGMMGEGLTGDKVSFGQKNLGGGLAGDPASTLGPTYNHPLVKTPTRHHCLGAVG